MVQSAVSLYFKNIGGSIGAEAFADIRMRCPGEGVFDVNLKFVDFPVSQPFDKIFEGVYLRYFAAGDIIVDTASGEVGRVINAAGGDIFAADCQQFTQGLDGVVGAAVG